MIAEWSPFGSRAHPQSLRLWIQALVQRRTKVKTLDSGQSRLPVQTFALECETLGLIS
jgi:hypothetical protein